MSSNVTDAVKKRVIKEMTGHSGCWSCGGIAMIEVTYPVKDGGATLREWYCENCIKKLYEREQVI